MSWLRRVRHLLSHSLRLRLMFMFVLLALALAATFLAGMQYAIGIGWRDAARPLVMDYVDRLASDIGSPPDVGRAQAITAALPLRISISGPQVNWSNQPLVSEHRERWRDRERWQQQDHLLERTTADGHRIVFALSVPAWEDRPRLIGWITLAVLLLLTAVAYQRVRRMLSPLDDIRAGALRFGAGDFGHAIPVRQPDRPDELGELAATINTMAADIQQLLDAKRGLLLAISHELRSPLTRARLNTELLPETEALQASRDALLRDLALMRDLVTDLLESERLSSRHAALNLERVDLAALVEELVQSLSFAVDRDIQPGLPALRLDPARVRLLLRNLLDNAARYGAAAAQPPKLTIAMTDAGSLQIQVRDFGGGVSDEQLSQLAEPFFRPDSARRREDGGVGLGLYLCQRVALAHGGSMEITNARPGLLISVTLPAQPGTQPP